MNKIFPDVDRAISDVSDGAVIMFGGFAEVGVPTHLIEALGRKGVKNLTTIANECGVSFQRKAIHLGLLVGNHQVKKMYASYPVAASAKEQSAFEQQYRAGQIEFELVPQGTLAERIRAGGAGIPAFLTPTGVGTVVEKGKQKMTIDGREYLLERALKADFAFVKAYKADHSGNLIYRRAARNYNPIMASAARITIAEVEHIVPDGELDPETVATPGIFVHRIVEVPK